MAEVEATRYYPKRCHSASPIKLRTGFDAESRFYNKMEKILTINILIILAIAIVPKIYSCGCEKKVKKKLTTSYQSSAVSYQLETDSSGIIANKVPRVVYSDEYKNLKFIGAMQCKLCHSREYRKWEKTNHAKAYEDMEKHYKEQVEEVISYQSSAISLKSTADSTKLKTKSSLHIAHSLKQADSRKLIGSIISCEPCHTTGYGYKFGFIDKQSSNNLIGVQCEICHGPGGEHIKNPKQVKMSFWDKPILEELCRSCHDKEISEKFEFEKYIKRIKCK